MFILLTITVAGYVGYYQFYSSTNRTATGNEEAEDAAEVKIKLLKDKKLQNAFKQILSKKETERVPANEESETNQKSLDAENETVKNKLRESVLSSSDFAEQFMDMSEEDKSNTLLSLKTSIESDQMTIQALKEAKEDSSVAAIEERLEQNKRQLQELSNL